MCSTYSRPIFRKRNRRNGKHWRSNSRYRPSRTSKGCSPCLWLMRWYGNSNGSAPFIPRKEIVLTMQGEKITISSYPWRGSLRTERISTPHYCMRWRTRLENLSIWTGKKAWFSETSNMPKRNWLPNSPPLPSGKAWEYPPISGKRMPCI